MDAAIAALNAATHRVAEANTRSKPPRTTSSSIRSTSPTIPSSRRATGRIQYRVANVGEVLPAGGKVFTMLDISYVYMDMYLPTAEAGRVRLGSEARIVLDAYPDPSDPGQGRIHRQPGAVHAQDRRNQGRARQADVPHPRADRSRAAARPRRMVRSGLPGVAYVRTDPDAAWPAKSASERRSDDQGAAHMIARRSRTSRIFTARQPRSTLSRSRFPAGCIVGLIGPDGVGKSSLLQHHRRRPADPIGRGLRPRRRHGRRRAPRARSARASPICRRGSARISIPISACARTSNFSAACSANPAAERERRIAELLDGTGLAPFRRSPGEEAVGRHAAEARPLLRPDPRSRSADPRRADDRRRSAVAPPVLGADRPDAVARAEA